MKPDAAWLDSVATVMFEPAARKALTPAATDTGVPMNTALDAISTTRTGYRIDRTTG